VFYFYSLILVPILLFPANFLSSFPTISCFLPTTFLFFLFAYFHLLLLLFLFFLFLLLSMYLIHHRISTLTCSKSLSSDTHLSFPCSSRQTPSKSQYTTQLYMERSSNSRPQACVTLPCI
jgi:hypothetical protein